MLEGYACFDEQGLKVEVNYNAYVSPCKIIKFTIGGKSVVIDRAYLYQMMMIFGDTDQQEQLIPVTETTVKPVKRLLKVKAKQDIKKGETISVVHTVYIPMLKKERIRLTPKESDDMEKNLKENQAAVDFAKQTGVLHRA